MNARNDQQVHGPAANLRQVDAVRRAAEIASYQKNPQQPMPVMFPIAELGARIAWPSNFR